ncbi:MAG TPA: hypothetical protein PLN21_10700, partial [Gemmatales bacterium]|nr:hypothetical protein [Gemmatales bacterium]
MKPRGDKYLALSHNSGHILSGFLSQHSLSPEQESEANDINVMTGTSEVDNPAQEIVMKLSIQALVTSTAVAAL